MSPWVLPLVLIKKKDRRTRWVTDLRELNKQMVKDSYLLTIIQEILHSLRGATVFSYMDACGAYHTVRIEPGSQAYTAYLWRELFSEFKIQHTTTPPYNPFSNP